MHNTYDMQNKNVMQFIQVMPFIQVKYLIHLQVMQDIGYIYLPIQEPKLIQGIQVKQVILVV